MKSNKLINLFDTSYVKFCLTWMFANIIATMVGAVINFLVYFLSDSLKFFDDTWDTIEVIALFLMALIFSSLFSIVQWFVLRKRLNDPRLWITLTILGSISGMVLIFFLPKLSVSMNLPPTFFGGIVGLSLGIAQWFALKRQVRQAGWWILISVISVTASVLVNYDCNCGVASPIGALFIWGTHATKYAGVYSLISGVCLGIMTSPNNLLRSDKNSL